MIQKNGKKIILALAFILIGFGLMQIPFTQIIGSNLNFSLFDFYGPIIGGFTGSIWGLIIVGTMQLANWFWHGLAVDSATIIRFFPMLFAVLYFARKSRFILFVPIVAMIGFWLHPEGIKAWYYALYWLIPIICYFFHGRFILARALGTTFTAHAVGGVLWLWVFNLKAAVWVSLIPVVWKERGLMALGITVTYLIFNYALSFAVKKIPALGWLNINRKYLLENK